MLGPRKEITLTFEWDGQTVHKETKGFKGKSCAKETQFIDEALGGGVESTRVWKPEANFVEYNKPGQTQQQQGLKY